MFLLKCLHFFGSAASATQYLYTSLFYYEYFNLTKQEIGLIASLSPLVSLFAIPITIHYSKNLKRTGLIVLILGSLIWSFHLFIPQDHSSAIGMILFITIGSAMTISSVGTILDSLTLELLLDKSLYGQQRLFGSISWGLSSLLTGMVMQWKGIWVPFYGYFVFISVFFVFWLLIPKHVENVEEEVEPLRGSRNDGTIEYSSSGLVHSEGDIVIPNEQSSLLDQSLIPKHVQKALGEERDRTIEYPTNNAIHSEGGDESIPLTLYQVLKHHKSISFFTCISLLGLVYAVIGQYLFIYLATSWQASPTLLGLTTPFSVACEVPTFYYSGYLLQKVGRAWMLITSLVLMLLRMALYIILPILLSMPDQNWIITGVEMLHGASYGLQWAAGMSFLETLGPGQVQQSLVGIFCSLSNNAGGVLGNVVGGIVYERYGYVGLWGVCSVILGLSLFSFLIAMQYK